VSERPEITLVVDGVEVNAPEGEMLVDAAKGGDVEIPVFCYEPKLGGPVGACRMCLVEIEGIPKLQTACSTPVRDGMVVYTGTDRVVEAQNAVVEFLLVNHPLDCPVCDKGGECPLQDIAMGWGPGRSRVTDPKRHFRKPVPLSPLVRIDRERCILCYRCVRFSQDVAEDEQLQLLERGASSYVGTFDDRPYIAPFHGNIIELCPVGALTAEAYRFRARPWEIEDSGSVCTLCPSQCNVKFTVRDERVERVLARDNREVDDGWLCDKGRFGFQMIASEERITEPRLSGNRAAWDAALATAAQRLGSGQRRIAAIVGGQASNEEAHLVQRVVRGALGSPHVTALDEIDPTLAALSAPGLGASIADVDAAESVLLVGADPLNSMPILDLRLRKAIRHSNLRLVIASDRPTALDGGAEETARYLPGEAAAFLAKLAAEVGSGPGEAGDFERLAGELRPGKTIVIWGERLGRGPQGGAALGSLLEICEALDCSAEGGGVFSVPDGANARGVREVGCLAGLGPGFAPVDAGRGLEGIKQGLADGELDGVILLHADPIRDLPDGPGWAKALNQARTVLSISCFDDASTKAADIVFPAEAYAEKEGTLTHPDGRLQRLRPAVPRPGRVRPIWQVLAELAAALGHETGIDSAPEALAAIAAEVPFYAGLTPEEIGGAGIRWQTRPQSGAFPDAGEGVTPPTSRATSTEHRATGLRLGTYRDLWADEASERNVALRFLVPEQRVELAPADAEELGLADGDEVSVRSNGTSVTARVALRERMMPGAAFLIDGTAAENANRLGGAEVVEIAKP
jgi:NADH-quinone oxidoreductase subunit G